MTTSNDWNAMTRRALEALGADKFLVPGAKLRQQLEALAAEEGADLRAYLYDNRIKFAELVERDPKIVVYRRPGTDMSVGFQGAAWPSTRTETAKARQTTGVRLRRDAYAAFTRISDQPYYYIPDNDRFTTDATESTKAIGVPRVTLEGLVSTRRAFAGQLAEPESRDQLLRALDYSPNPLSDFQRTVHALHLGRLWHQFNVDTLRSRMTDWAEENGTAFSPTWLEDDSESSATTVSPQELLAQLARHLTDDEVRQLRLPFAAFEAMYSDLRRRP